jgi:hypothetical protein
MKYILSEIGNGIKNGRLLQPLIEHVYDALLTFDKNLQHQQNFAKYTMTVFVLSAEKNTYDLLTKLTPAIKDYSNASPLPIGPIVVAA